MKVLVMDDNAGHRKAAAILLKDHDLTVVGTYKEAEKLLTPQCDWNKLQSMLKAEFGGFDQYDPKADEATKVAYRKREKEISKEITVIPDFDAVLTDLLIPTEKGFGGQEIPMGTTIALRAIAAGAKYVAVVTDANHHDNAASAAFDGFPLFTVGDVKVLCTNRCIESVHPETYERAKDGSVPREYILVKNWGHVLKRLTGEVHPNAEW